MSNKKSNENNTARFLIRSVEIADRHIEPKKEYIPDGCMMLPKYESLLLRIDLIGSGDTRKISDNAILGIVMDKLNEIKL